jgi:hypothetical protein
MPPPFQTTERRPLGKPADVTAAPLERPAATDAQKYRVVTPRHWQTSTRSQGYRPTRSERLFSVHRRAPVGSVGDTYANALAEIPACHLPHSTSPTPWQRKSGMGSLEFRSLAASVLV